MSFIKIKTRKTILLVIIVSLVALGLLWYTNRHESNNTDGSPSKEDIKKDNQHNEDKKRALIEGGSQSSQNSQQQLSLDVSARQESDKSVTILGKIKGLTGNNKCKLSISNNGKVINQEADVIYQTEFSSCAGFNIGVDQLGTGVWTINLAVGDRSSSTTTEVK